MTNKNTKNHTDVLVLGGGPGGYTAAFRAADLGKQVTLVERYPMLGGVCLNVGCIPSKALLHVAQILHEAEGMAKQGVSFGKPKIDLDKIRSWKDGVSSALTQGLAGLAKQRKVTVIQGTGHFASDKVMELKTANGIQNISFDSAIIAAGSQASEIPIFPNADPRLMDSTDALLLEEIPKKVVDSRRWNHRS